MHRLSTRLLKQEESPPHGLVGRLLQRLALLRDMNT